MWVAKWSTQDGLRERAAYLFSGGRVMTDYEWETMMDYSPEEQMMDTYEEWAKQQEAMLSE